VRPIAWAIAGALVLPIVQAGQPVFRVSVEAVRLDVSVTRHDQPVTGLTRDDFIVTDHGVPQVIQTVAPDDGPLSLILVVDTSDSMAGKKLEDLKQAGRALLDVLRPADRTALVSFSQQILVPLPLTSNRDAARAALASLQALGATALRDALFTALQLRPTDTSRPLILIFSDGVDDASWLTRDEVLEAVRRAGITIDAVEIGATRARRIPGSRGIRDMRPVEDLLRDAADVSGGETWLAGSSDELSQLFTHALEAMRTRYLISYVPEGVPRDGWHDVRVRLAQGSADVRTRTGYFVGSSSSSPR
jgi:VWFA-related protein